MPLPCRRIIILIFGQHGRTYYQWLHKPLSDRAIENRRLVGAIRNSYAASGGVYGARRVLGDLREAGETRGKTRVERLMRVRRIKAFRATRRRAQLQAGRPSSRQTDAIVNLP